MKFFEHFVLWLSESHLPQMLHILRNKLEKAALSLALQEFF